MLDALQRLARDRVEARLVWGLGLGLGGVKVSGLGGEAHLAAPLQP